MKTSRWIPQYTIKARKDLERLLVEELKVEEEVSFKIDLKQIHSPSLFSEFLAFFRKKSS